MTKLVIVISIWLTSTAFAGIVPEQDWEGRVVGGSVAEQGQFPYQVNLQIGTLIRQQACGGAIIGSRFVLTAAHCLDGQTTGRVRVVVGTNSRSSGGTTLQVARFIIHPGWDRNILANDIAIIETTTDIPLDQDNVATIPIATEPVLSGRATVSGWGQTSNPGLPSSVLRFVEKGIISNDECRDRLRPNNMDQLIDGGKLCAFERQGVGSCMGDSGGPLTSNGQLVGIVSWGIPCGRGFPDMYARVDFYSSWIKQVTGL